MSNDTFKKLKNIDANKITEIVKSQLDSDTINASPSEIAKKQMNIIEKIKKYRDGIEVFDKSNEIKPTKLNME